ncbi:MAG: VacB/RNase II family 3'-5' exoribonuclease [Verrucomicrobiales bacterium]
MNQKKARPTGRAPQRQTSASQGPDLVAIIRDFVRKPGFVPANKSELARQLRILPDDRAEFREALRKLIADGTLTEGRKGRLAPADRPGTSRLTGTIVFPAKAEGRGHAWFIAEVPEAAALRGSAAERIHVPARYTGTALHGDTVTVEVSRRKVAPWERFDRQRQRDQADPAVEAHVCEVIGRRHQRIVGTYHAHPRFPSVTPDLPMLPQSLRLVNVLPEAKAGDKVAVEITSWESRQQAPQARMVRVLGAPGTPGVDILTVICSHDLPLEFPPEVLAEAASLPSEVHPDMLKGREDWRNQPVFTIDPFDAKDFDDAIAVKPLPEGGWELAVHIADVSYFVRPGTALDREAKIRGNSVYLVDRVIPMLPEKLSNGVCSLKPDVDRLTFAAILTFNAHGVPKGARFTPAVIRSARRYTYEEAYERLQLTPDQIAGLPKHEASFAKHLHESWLLAKTLRDRRFREGALDLDFVETKVILDQDGVPVEVRRVQNDISHQLIEECMLAANEAVARETKLANHPAIYRIHEDPDEERLMDFREQARTYGHKAGDVTQRPELQKLLRSIRGLPEEHALKIALLKSLKRAAYSADPLGHYGLAKLNYTHFTSPIRRYADLIVHRVLRRLLTRRKTEPGDKSGSTPGYGRLVEIARHISETERNAADAENETKKLKLIEYLMRLTKAEPDRTFEAVINDVRPGAAFVELTAYYIKGMIKSEDLPRGARPTLQVGQRVEVRVVRVDPVRGFIDFTIPEGSGKNAAQESSARPSSRRPRTAREKNHHQGRRNRPR